jgi:hypothetical protein
MVSTLLRAVITEAGNHPEVKGLVYVAAVP